jgi:hypothetical protein
MRHPSRSLVAVATLALVLLPSVARAQGGANKDNTPFAGRPASIVPISLAKVVIDNEKDMVLTDAQRVQIVLIQRGLDSASAPLLAHLDSIKPTWRPAGGLNDLSEEQRRQLVAHRQVHEETMAKIAPSAASAREKVMALLDRQQQERAAKLEKNARKRAQELAKRELEELERPAGMMRRRGEIRDATGRTPLG